jgi:hypothetical protein
MMAVAVEGCDGDGWQIMRQPWGLGKRALQYESWLAEA